MIFNTPILSIKPLGFMWPTTNPFLFCAHHRDLYPAGNEKMGPAASLSGRDIGQDFTPKDGWRMYHGQEIPGFPVHPHRGFETITIVKEGFVDHSDSHGQAGRFGQGDVQWMTAGSGLQHCEMFPLLNQDGPNPAELFQIWLNMPKANKFAAPYYKMLWSEEIPKQVFKDANGRTCEVTQIAGSLDGQGALPNAPDSWASNPDHEVAVWTIKLEPGAVWVLPSASEQVNRTLYFHVGNSLVINQTKVDSGHAISLKANQSIQIENGDSESHLLLLQGKPIDEPIVQHGPFVMNSKGEIQEAFEEYNATEFGGWPWPSREMVHPREKGRFAKYNNGVEETR
jgi:redox-sensitive bicupin YhaK (pirin superfamily)